MSDFTPPIRHRCVDCGVRLYNKHRARKHSSKTGHRCEVDAQAQRAVEKYRARQYPSYLDRLIEKEAQYDHESNTH